MKMIAGSIVILASTTLCSTAVLGLQFGPSDSRGLISVFALIVGFILGNQGGKVFRDGAKESNLHDHS
jgi:hypothetical protein